MKRRGLTLGLLVLPWLIGCGDDENKDTGLSKAQTEAVTAVRGTWHDWPAVTLSNGLVTVNVVAEAGGRILGFDFADRSLLYANPRLYGQLPGEGASRRFPWVPGTGAAEPAPAEPTATDQPTEEPGVGGEAGPRLDEPEPAALEEVPGGGVRLRAVEATGETTPVEVTATEPPVAEPAEATEVAGEPPATGLETEPLRYLPSQTTEQYRSYGGQVSWPGPRSHWTAAWPPPVPLDLGRYAAAVPKTDGDWAEVELTSPPDEELGVRLTKTARLLRGSTVLQVRTTLANLGARTRLWSISDISQHPGALTPGETFTRDAQLVVPLAPASRLNLGFAALLGPQTSEQYFPEEGLLRLEYLGQEGLVGTDDHRGWVAWCDRRRELVLVKLAWQPTGGSYPEGGLTTLLYTAPADKESYVQAELRSPLQTVRPNETMNFAVQYAATTCPLPIVAASRAGVVNQPLKAESLGDSVRLTGVFGSFYTGHLQVVFYDAEGQALARTRPEAVSPTQPVRLDLVSVLPDNATRAVAVITNHRRIDVGELSDAAIAPMTPAAAGSFAIEPAPVEAVTEPTVPAVTPGGEPAGTGVRTPMDEAGETPAAERHESIGETAGPGDDNPTGKEPSDP